MQVAAETEGAQRRSARASGGLRLRRGRTRILAGGDLAALTLAYAVTYAASEQIGSVPPGAAPARPLPPLRGGSGSARAAPLPAPRPLRARAAPVSLPRLPR